MGHLDSDRDAFGISLVLGVWDNGQPPRAEHNGQRYNPVREFVSRPKPRIGVNSETLSIKVQAKTVPYVARTSKISTTLVGSGTGSPLRCSPSM